MTKLRNLITAALLTLCVTSLNASAAMTTPSHDGFNPTHQVMGTCYIYFNGRWWAIPC
jgi:Spy/CpxP family protein refolding chaperone